MGLLLLAYIVLCLLAVRKSGSQQFPCADDGGWPADPDFVLTPLLVDHFDGDDTLAGGQCAAVDNEGIGAGTNVPLGAEKASERRHHRADGWILVDADLRADQAAVEVGTAQVGSGREQQNLVGRRNRRDRIAPRFQMKAGLAN